MMKAGDETPVDGIYFSFLNANGIRHRLASNQRNLGQINQCASSSSQQQQQPPYHRQRTSTKHHPLIFFLHGFPESWYSWRHQLTHLRDKPFLSVAPDMRGYHSTSQPKTSIRDYTLPVLAKDVVEIASALGYQQFIVIGHDWGAMLAWHVALLHPSHVLGVCGLSVPYAGIPKVGLLTMLQAKYGQCLESSEYDDDGDGDGDEDQEHSKHNYTKNKKLSIETLKKAKFNYILHHCLPNCAKEYDKNCYEFLYRIYGYTPGCDVVDGTPEYDIDGPMFIHHGHQEKQRRQQQQRQRQKEDPTEITHGNNINKNSKKKKDNDSKNNNNDDDDDDTIPTLVWDATTAPGLWHRIPKPKSLPAWLTMYDLEYYTSEFERSGFFGGLCWYRASNENTKQLRRMLLTGDVIKDDKIRIPSLFISGENDDAIELYGGKTKVISRLKASLLNLLKEPMFIPNCGHWIHQEYPKQVNETLMGFIETVLDKANQSNVGTATSTSTQLIPSKL